MVKSPSKQLMAEKDGTGPPAASVGGDGGGAVLGDHTEILVVGTKIKDVVKSAGCMSSAELLEAVSIKVHDMLLAAAERAKQNGRTTVRPYDL